MSIEDSIRWEYSSSAAELRFELALSRSPKARVSVDYATSDGTADAGDDYGAMDGTLKFELGVNE